MKRLLVRLSLGLDERDIDDTHKTIVGDLFRRGFLKKNQTRYTLNSKYRFGTVRLSDKKNGAYLHVVTETLKDIFIAQEDLSGAHEGDLVVVQRYIAKKGPPSGKVVAVIGREESYHVAIVLRREGEKKLLDLKTLHPSGAHIQTDRLESYPEGTLLQIDDQTGTVMSVLGNIDDPKTDEAIVLAQFNKHDEFDETVLAEVRGFDEVDASLFPKRKDLRALPFCTIDPVSAKDFDDAIYWDSKNATLYVAIADVSHYVKPFGALDNEAMHRGFSIYLPHRSIPMLPRILSERLCSLQPDVDRLAYVFEIMLDTKRLVVKSSRLYEAIIHSKRRFTYDEVDAIFANKLRAKTKTEAEIFLYLKSLRNVTNALRKRRLEKGFDFRSEEISLRLDTQTNLLQTEVEKETPSHALIEDCMLLANKEAAALYERGIFRIHEEPSQAKLQNLYEELFTVGINVEIKETVKETIEDIRKKAQEAGMASDVDTLIIRSQMQARYAPVNIGHFGLGFDRYTHFTSPIRRYSDLIVHRHLKAIAKHDKEEEEYVLRNLEALCIRLSQLEREADTVEKEYAQRKFARWAKERLNQTFRAKIVATLPEYKAELDDTIRGAMLHVTSSKNQVALFQHVNVKIENVDIYKAKIFASIVE